MWFWEQNVYCVRAPGKKLYLQFQLKATNTVRYLFLALTTDGDSRLRI